jgi:hypothetical protein
MPVYLPKSKTVQQVRAEMMKSIMATAPSYGMFGATCSIIFEDPNERQLEKWYGSLNNIPNAAERQVPQYLIRGIRFSHKGRLKEYVDAGESRQRVEYVQVGAGHAFSIET